MRSVWPRCWAAQAVAVFNCTEAKAVLGWSLQSWQFSCLGINTASQLPHIHTLLPQGCQGGCLFRKLSRSGRNTENEGLGQSYYKTAEDKDMLS